MPANWCHPITCSQNDVLRDLPPKREQIVAVELSTSQKQVGLGCPAAANCGALQQLLSTARGESMQPGCLLHEAHGGTCQLATHGRPVSIRRCTAAS